MKRQTNMGLSIEIKKIIISELKDNFPIPLSVNSQNMGITHDKIDGIFLNTIKNLNDEGYIRLDYLGQITGYEGVFAVEVALSERGLLA